MKNSELLKKVNIYVATHKEINFDLPSERFIMQVNCDKSEVIDGSYLKDNEGIDNLSSKNSYYCEMTVHYQLWKNCLADIKGLEHYRRYFTSDSSVPSFPQKEVLSTQLSKYLLSYHEILDVLKMYDIILATNCCPYPFTAFEDLHRFCYEEDILRLVQCIEKECPEYLVSLVEVLCYRNIAYRNMLITKSSIFDAYSEWVFGVLSQVEKIINVSEYDVRHQRILGYFAEVLLNVYVKEHDLKPKYYQIAFPLEGDLLSQSKEYIKMQIRSFLIHTGLCDKFNKYRYYRNRYVFNKSKFIENDKRVSLTCEQKSLKMYYEKCGASYCSLWGNDIVIAVFPRTELTMEIISIIKADTLNFDEVVDRKEDFLKNYETKNCPVFRVITKDLSIESSNTRLKYIMKGIVPIHISDLK